MTAVEELVGLGAQADPYRSAPKNLAELQLEAIRERFAERRQQVKVLDMRARDTGVDEIRSLDDVVPLLFSHTNYKSYPEQFIDRGQWKHMNLWLQTLSAVPVDVPVDDVTDVDDWIKRLKEHGHMVFASSGTSGKNSFLNQTRNEAEFLNQIYTNALDWTRKVPAQSMPWFGTFPPAGVHKMSVPIMYGAHKHALPGDVHVPTNEPVLAMQTIKAGQLRRAMAAGTARPEEIEAFQAENAARAERMAGHLEAFYDKLFARRNEPIHISGMWPSLYKMVEAGRARGLKDGEFHPGTIVGCGGGIKGAVLPPDFKEQIERFFGVPKTNWVHSYGMVEVTGLCPWSHEAGGYAIPPWLVPLVLDKSGEKLLNPKDWNGQVEGRMAFFDIATEGRWGGLISGDKVEIDFAPAQDNLRVPVIRSVARYSELEEGDDKLTCAGTVDSYVRGIVLEE